MQDRASRWALVASMAVHFGVVGVPLLRSPRAHDSSSKNDFWAGSTFEPPSEEGEANLGGDVGQETINEINVEGLNVSSKTDDVAPPHEVPSEETAPGLSAAPLPNAAPTTPPSTSKAKGRAPAAAVARANRAPSRAALGGSGGTPSSGGRGNLPFGAEGTAPGVRDLLRSFVRVLPIVASADPVWGTLPLGGAGSADITLTLDEEGKPRAGPFDGAVPAHLRRLVQKGLSVMSSGRFAVGSESEAGATQKIHVAISLEQLAAPTSDPISTGGAFGLRFEPPDEHQVSRAFFTLASGRRVEISVRPRTRGH